MSVVIAAPYIGQAASFKYRLIFAQVSESSGSLYAFIVYSFRTLGRVAFAREFCPDLAPAVKVGLWAIFAAFVVR
jgi:hypothetical protein